MGFRFFFYLSFFFLSNAKLKHRTTTLGFKAEPSQLICCTLKGCHLCFISWEKKVAKQHAIVSRTVNVLLPALPLAAVVAETGLGALVPEPD